MDFRNIMNWDGSSTLRNTYWVFRNFQGGTLLLSRIHTICTERNNNYLFINLLIVSKNGN